MNRILILLLAFFFSTAVLAHSTKSKRCTSTKTQTVITSGTGKYIVSYVTTTTTLTQAVGTFTTTLYELPLTITVSRPEAITTKMVTVTETVTTGKALSVSTVTVTNSDATATYITTIKSYTASAISTILLETSDSPNNYKMWAGLQLTLLLIGSFVFFI